MVLITYILYNLCQPPAKPLISIYIESCSFKLLTGKMIQQDVNRPMVAYMATLALRAAEAEATAGQEGSRRLRTLALRTVRSSVL